MGNTQLKNVMTGGKETKEARPPYARRKGLHFTNGNDDINGNDDMKRK